jgi:hypothetical protein
VRARRDDKRERVASSEDWLVAEPQIYSASLRSDDNVFLQLTFGLTRVKAVSRGSKNA